MLCQIILLIIIYQFCKIFLYKTDVIVLYCDQMLNHLLCSKMADVIKEHLKSPSPIHDHSNISGHKVTINNFEIVGREDLKQMRTIKEAIYIRVNDPSLDRNVGKYHLPHVWDEVLANISELKLK